MPLTTDDLDALVTWTLIRAAHVAERELTVLFAEHGLSPVQFGILAHLATGSTSTQAELARQVLVRPQTVAGIVDGMVERDLITRAGPRERGRRNPIALTLAGQAVLDEVWPRVRAANDPDALGLTRGDLDTLNHLLHHLLTQRPHATQTEGPTSEQEATGL